MRNRPLFAKTGYRDAMLPLIGGSYAGCDRSSHTRRQQKNSRVVGRPLGRAGHLSSLQDHRMDIRIACHIASKTCSRWSYTECSELSAYHGRLQEMRPCNVFQFCADRGFCAVCSPTPIFTPVSQFVDSIRRDVAARKSICVAAHPRQTIGIDIWATASPLSPEKFLLEQQCALDTWGAL
jgi:hypothetical protein